MISSEQTGMIPSTVASDSFIPFQRGRPLAQSLKHSQPQISFVDVLLLCPSFLLRKCVLSTSSLDVPVVHGDLLPMLDLLLQISDLSLQRLSVLEALLSRLSCRHRVSGPLDGDRIVLILDHDWCQ